MRRVVVKYDPDREAVLVGQGPEVSTIRWLDTRQELHIVNSQIEIEEEAAVMSLTTNTRGATKMGTNYDEMTGQELVALYNKLADKPVKRFSTRVEAIKRVRAIEAKAPAKVPAKAKADAREPISVEFGCRAGTNREKLLLTLYSSLNKQVPVPDLLKDVYGSKAETNRGAVMMVTNGLVWMIENRGLSYKVVKEKSDDGETTIGLHSIK